MTSLEHVQAETSRWIKEELAQRRKTLAWLATKSGVERTALVNGVNLKRKLTLHEVLQIAHTFGKVPPLWNNIEKTTDRQNHIPLYGNVSSAVWRLRGTEMPIGTAPLEPVTAVDYTKEEQFSHLIETGRCKNQFAICVPIRGEPEVLEQDDVVVVEETRTVNLPEPRELFRRVLRRIIHKDGAVRLTSYDDDGDSEVGINDCGINVTGLVIGFFLPVRQKIGGKI